MLWRLVFMSILSFQPNVRKIILKNGLKILLYERTSYPTVYIGVFAYGGSFYETEENNGITFLTLRVMTKATKNADYKQISKKLDKLGGNFSYSSESYYVSLHMNVLSEDLEEAIELLSDIIKNPTFPEDEIKKEKEKQISDIKSMIDNPYEMMFLNLAKAIYGNWGYGLSDYGKIENIKKFTRSDLVNWHKKIFCAKNMLIVIVGDFDGKSLVSLLKKKFEDIPSGDVLKPVKFSQNSFPREVVIERNYNQTYLGLGFRVMDLNSSDYLPFMIFSKAVSGMGRRFFVELRDKKHLAYAVWNLYRANPLAGYFGVYIATFPEKEKEAVEGILEILKNLKENGLTQKEFEDAKTQYEGEIKTFLVNNRNFGITFALGELYGFGWDWKFKMIDKVRELKLEDVNSVLKKYLKIKDYKLGIVRGKSR